VNISIVGRGRAGTSFELALRAAGHSVRIFAHDHLSTVTPCDLILLCVPDDHVAEVARNLPADDQAVVAHIAGSRTLEVLGDHPRVGSLHPLVALSSPEIGARRLQGATYSVAGDPLLFEVVESLGGVLSRGRLRGRESLGGSHGSRRHSGRQGRDEARRLSSPGLQRSGRRA